MPVDDASRAVIATVPPDDRVGHNRVIRGAAALVQRCSHVNRMVLCESAIGDDWTGRPIVTQSTAVISRVASEQTRNQSWRTTEVVVNRAAFAVTLVVSKRAF